MQKPLQITFRDMEPSPSFDAIIRQRASNLERMYPRLIGCAVVVEVPHRGSESAKVPISVMVEVNVPGRDPIVGKDQQERHESKEDRAGPINRAFDAVERQLRKLSSLREHDEPPGEGAQQSGMIVRLFAEQSYGFVQIDNSTELYFTRNAVAGEAFDALELGMLVHVTRATEEGPMGPQASSIRLDSARSAN